MLGSLFFQIHAVSFNFLHAILCHTYLGKKRKLERNSSQSKSGKKSIVHWTGFTRFFKLWSSNTVFCFWFLAQASYLFEKGQNQLNLAEGDSAQGTLQVFIVLILLFLLNKLSKKAPPRLCTGVKAASWISQEISADDLTGLAEKQPPFQKVTSTAQFSLEAVCWSAGLALFSLH